MKAELLIRRRVTLTDDAFVELVIWKVPQRIRGSTHDFKYRLAYIVRGACVLRYDNEAGKGDHLHIGGIEQPYEFTTINRLLSDFNERVRTMSDEDT